MGSWLGGERPWTGDLLIGLLGRSLHAASWTLGQELRALGQEASSLQGGLSSS